MRVQAGERRFGLTKVEVAVVAVVLVTGIGILIALLPRARESSDLVQCRYNLKQIGEALIRYDGRQRFLPASRIDDGYATWPVLLGPDLAPKADNPFKAWDLQKPYAGQTAEARKTLVPQFYCPARPRESRESTAGDLGPDGELLPGAVGDYGCASGNGDPTHPWDGPKANGPLIVGDVLQRDKDLVLAWQGRTALANLGSNRAYKILAGDKHVPLGKFGQASVGDGSIYNGANPKSSARVAGPGYGLARSPDAPFNLNFGSYHLGGVCQFILADGSVRPFTPDADELLLGRMTDRHVPPEKK
jgi:hypothetical protein